MKWLKCGQQRSRYTFHQILAKIKTKQQLHQHQHTKSSIYLCQKNENSQEINNVFLTLLIGNSIQQRNGYYRFPKIIPPNRTISGTTIN